MLLLPLFEGTNTSDREIMTLLQSHLRVNADGCLQDAARHSYYCSQPIRVWVCMASKGGTALLCVGLMESTTPCGVSLIMHQLSRPTLQEGKQKQLKARRRHKRHTNTPMQTSSRTLVIPACFHKPHKWCYMRTETTCTEVGHIWIYRPKRETEIPTRTHTHARACVNV